MLKKITSYSLLMIMILSLWGCGKPRWDTSKSVEAPEYVRFHNMGALDKSKVTKITPYNGVQISKIDGQNFGKIVYIDGHDSIIELMPGEHEIEVFIYQAYQTDPRGYKIEYGTYIPAYVKLVPSLSPNRLYQITSDYYYTSDSRNNFDKTYFFYATQVFDPATAKQGSKEKFDKVLALKEEDKLEEAFDILLSIVSTDQGYVPAYKELIQIIKDSKYTLGSTHDVFKLKEFLVTLLPENAAISADMATALWGIKKYKLASQYAHLSLQINPRHLPAVRVIANYFKQMGDTKALTSFCKQYPWPLKKNVSNCN